MISKIAPTLNTFRRLGGIALLSTGLIGISAPGIAQTYPTRHVPLVVGYPAWMGELLPLLHPGGPGVRQS